MQQPWVAAVGLNEILEKLCLLDHFGGRTKGETAREVSGVVQILAEVMAKCNYGAKDTGK